MLFATHLLLGILFYLIFHRFFAGGNEIIFFLMVLLGSILPDIDERSSTINRWTGVFGKVISFFFKHRGIFHSLFLALLLFLVISVYGSTYYATALLLGYIAHLVGDSFSPSGIQMFYPFSQFKFKGPLKVGGFLEWIVLVLLMVLVVVIAKGMI